MGEALVGNYPGRALSFAAGGDAGAAPRLLSLPGKRQGLFTRVGVPHLIARSDSNGGRRSSEGVQLCIRQPGAADWRGPAACPDLLERLRLCCASKCCSAVCSLPCLWAAPSRSLPPALPCQASTCLPPKLVVQARTWRHLRAPVCTTACHSLVGEGGRGSGWRYVCLTAQ